MITDSIEFRRHLHRRPELSFAEHATQRYIIERLGEAGIECRKVAGTGVLAVVEGRRGNRMRAVVLRADIDALPVEERTGAEFSSLTCGVMHACGHDVHAAVLYGVLCSLAAERDFEGTLIGLFQPGEECNPGGASMVLAEDPFAAYDVAAVIGEHVDSTLEVGQAGFCPGRFMASNDELRIRVDGRGGHAAMRGDLNDPVEALCRMTLRMLDLNTSQCVVSVGRLEADGATNVIPDTTRAEGTMRSFDEDVRRMTWERLRRAAAEVGEQCGVAIEVDIDRGYPCVVNDIALTYESMLVAAGEGIEVRELQPRATAEDFGYYTQRYPSLFYRLGVGSAAGRSHTSAFLPDERAIAVGVRLMRSIALHVLNK